MVLQCEEQERESQGLSWRRSQKDDGPNTSPSTKTTAQHGSGNKENRLRDSKESSSKFPKNPPKSTTTIPVLKVNPESPSNHQHISDAEVPKGRK
ncbi:unnamed protein product [Allacma fusca]|uniref:Uncharacterized protein n=1 Tax=Allacma fusca TaxID=39272 RepID=A0A8J2NXT0_9HEXA|nr:unnamed protein product [Allacma fusca]